MHSLFNILYTLCLHEWSCRDHKTRKLIISYSKVFKSFSHSWKFASDATSGSFELKCESTTSTKQKVSLANKKQTRRRLGKDLLNGDVHVPSDLLECWAKEEEPGASAVGKGGWTQGWEQLQEVLSWWRQQKLCWCCWGFLGVTATVRLHYFPPPFFFSFRPLLKNSSEN